MPRLVPFLLSVMLVGACRLLAPSAPCKVDTNCPAAEVCDLEAHACVAEADDRDGGPGRLDGGGDNDGGGGGDDGGPNVDGGDADGGGDAGVLFDAGLPGCVADDAGPRPAIDTDPCAGDVCTLRKVGHTADGCPTATGGTCDFDNTTQLQVIQAAIDASVDGDVVWLYGHPRDSFIGRVRLTSSITLEGAPGEDPRTVRITNAYDVETEPGLVQLVADNTTIRRFTIIAERRARIGVNAAKSPAGATQNDYSYGFSSGHMIEQLTLEAVGVAVASNNSTAEAILAGADTVIRNNHVFGWFEGMVVQPRDGSDLPGLRVVHNTFVAPEARRAVELSETSTGAVVRNNLLVTLNPAGTFAVGLGGNGTVDALVEGNVYSGYEGVTGDGVTEGVGNRETNAPGFVNWRRPLLATGAEVFCGGEPETEAGNVDLDGNARGDTVGAVQPASAEPVAPSVVLIGSAVNGCDGPCHFAGVDALRNAVARSAPGVRIVMHGDGQPTLFDTLNFAIDRRVTLTAPTGQSPDAVVLFHDAAPHGRFGALTVTHADGVVLENFSVRLSSGGDFGVLLDTFGSGQSGDAPSARDAIIRRVIVTTDATNGDAAFKVSAGSVVSNCAAFGDIEAFAHIEGNGAVVVNNTFLNTESTEFPAGALLHSSDDVVIANNLFDFSGAISGNPSTPLRSSSNGIGNYALPTNLVVERNQFYGAARAFDPLDIPLPLPSTDGTNCVSGAAAMAGDECAAAEPGFLDAANADVRIASGSPAENVGENSFVNGQADLLGRPRLNGTVDVGAVERADTDP